MFDPAAWLERAERRGYRIYLSGTPSGGRFRIVTEAPCRPKSTDDTTLWHEFQGRLENSKTNRAALIAHLVKLGRFGQGEGRSGSAAVSKEARAKRSRPKRPVGGAQDGR